MHLLTTLHQILLNFTVFLYISPNLCYNIFGDSFIKGSNAPIIHSILIIGQSNMGGRGFPIEVEPIVNGNILVARNGRWRPMYVPVNPDRVTSGINLAESFADLYAKEKGVQVGIIPCADGGTGLDQWAVGGLLFDHACYMAMLAQRTSTIAAVLWHQGESDCAEDKYPQYEKKPSADLAIVNDIELL